MSLHAFLWGSSVIFIIRKCGRAEVFEVWRGGATIFVIKILHRPPPYKSSVGDRSLKPAFFFFNFNSKFVISNDSVHNHPFKKLKNSIFRCLWMTETAQLHRKLHSHLSNAPYFWTKLKMRSPLTQWPHHNFVIWLGKNTPFGKIWGV